MIDYRDLLKKYIDLVGDEEGVTFIRHFNGTDEELNALRQLEHEANEESEARLK